MPLEPNLWQRWDRRFVVRVQLRGDLASRPQPPLTVRALGADGWCQCKLQLPHGVLRGLPAAVRTGLPSVWHDDRLLAVAGQGLVGPAAARLAIALRFRPHRPLAGPPFVASGAFQAPEPYSRIAGNHTFAST
jgi:hypothetical protein